MTKRTDQPAKFFSVIRVLVDGFLLLFLVIQAWLLGCLYTHGYIPIPANWADRQLAQRIPAQFRLSVGTYGLRFNGRIELHDLEIYADGFEAPLLEVGYASVLMAPKRAGFGLEMRQVFLGGATCTLPAVYAADGKRNTVLEKVRLQLSRHRDGWQVPVFAAKHENFILRGSVDLPPLKGPLVKEELEAEAALDALFKMIATPLKHKHWLSFLEEPTLVFELNVSGNNSASLSGQLFSAQLEHPEAQGKNLQIDTEFTFRDNELVADEPLHVKAEALSVPRFGVSADSLSAQVEAGQWQSLLEGGLPRIWIAAGQIEIEFHRLEGPELHLDLSDHPFVNFSGSSGGPDGAVAFRGQMDVEKRSGFVNAEGNLDVLALLPSEILEHENMPLLYFEAEPYYRLAIQFKPDLVIKRAEVAATAHGFKVADLSFRYLDAQVLYEDGRFSLNDTVVERDARQSLDLAGSYDRVSGDYRVRLVGFAIPYEYNALLPGWWARIFEDFEFAPSSRGQGDFAIYGNSGHSIPDLYFGHAQASELVFKGLRADEVELIVRGSGHYVELHGIEASSGEGWARGNLSFTSRDDAVKGPLSVRYDFDAMMPIDGIGSVFGPTVEGILSDFEIEQMPRITLSGVYFNEAYPEYEALGAYSLSADSMGPIRYKELPLDELRLKVEGRSEKTFLREVEFAYAGGKGEAQFDIFTTAETKPQLSFMLELKGADQKTALANLPDFGNLDKTLKEASRKDTETDSDNGSAIIEAFKLQARGVIDDSTSFHGNGEFHLIDENLGAIQLLGPLSVLLRNTWFNFTSFNLREMKTNFDLAGAILSFDDLRIDGTQTKVQISGNLNWMDQSLDMRAAVRLLGNVGGQASAFRRINDMVSGALPNLLEFHLGGTVQSPSWRSIYDPRNWNPLGGWL